MKYGKDEAKEYARERLRGLWGASTTPFTADLLIDEAAFRANLRHWRDDLRLGGIFISGKMGEFFSLSLAERKRTFEIAAVEASGSFATIMSTWDMNLANTVALTQHAEAVGGDFAIIMNPFFYFGAATDETVYGFYEYVAERVNIGIGLWNSPEQGYAMSPQLVARLAQIPNVVAIKNSLPHDHCREVTRLAGDRLIVSSPNEHDWLEKIVELGWQVYLASPEAFVMQTKEDSRFRHYTELAMKGEVAAARQVRDSLEPVRHALHETRPAGKTQAQLKYWQELLGQAGGPVRPPLLQLTAEEKARIREAFEACGLSRVRVGAATA